MPRVPRGALPAALSLLVLNLVVLATQPSTPKRVASVSPPTSAVTTSSTTTTSLPPATTTSTVVAPKPRPVTTAAPHPATTAAPAPIPAHLAPRPGSVACGWSWDAIRIDDGSSNEVTMTLSAPSRPSQAVTITATFGGPDTPPASHATTTDASGQAVTKFDVSEDKRDWTITISATFPAGGTCPGETFTLNY